MPIDPRVLERIGGWVGDRVDDLRDLLPTSPAYLGGMVAGSAATGRPMVGPQPPARKGPPAEGSDWVQRMFRSMAEQAKAARAKPARSPDESALLWQMLQRAGALPVSGPPAPAAPPGPVAPPGPAPGPMYQPAQELVPDAWTEMGSPEAAQAMYEQLRRQGKNVGVGGSRLWVGDTGRARPTPLHELPEPPPDSINPMTGLPYREGPVAPASMRWHRARNGRDPYSGSLSGAPAMPNAPALIEHAKDRALARALALSRGSGGGDGRMNDVIAALFEQQHGRAPTQREVDRILLQLRGLQVP